MTDDAFERYAASPEGEAYLASELFVERCQALFDRLDSGKPMSLEAAAVIVGLPVPVFARVWGEYAAGQQALRRRHAMH